MSNPDQNNSPCAIREVIRLIFDSLSTIKTSYKLPIYSQIPDNASLPFIYIGNFTSKYKYAYNIKINNISCYASVHADNLTSAELLELADLAQKAIMLADFSAYAIKLKFIEVEKLDSALQTNNFQSKISLKLNFIIEE